MAAPFEVSPQLRDELAAIRPLIGPDAYNRLRDGIIELCQSVAAYQHRKTVESTLENLRQNWDAALTAMLSRESRKPQTPNRRR